MADRTVRVSLIAQASGFISEVDKATRKVQELGTEAEKLAQKRQAFTELGTSALAIGTLAAVGAGLAIARFAEFDKAMSAVQAATHESASNMGQLREAALDAGASTVFTARESANAIEELAKAGIETSDILGGALAGSLDLASAGSLGVAQAAEIAATAMTQFGVAGSDVPHIADLLAAGAGKAQGSVEDMGMALKQAGLVASSTGLTIEETTGSLAAFASAGLLGSDAGTSFRSMLQRLTPQSAEAQKEMDRLGISAYDAGGSFIGMEAFAGNLQDSLSGLTDEQRNASLAVIFGSDAVRAANVLYEQGAEGIGDWNDKVNDSGYAAETARIKLDNLSGDVEKLGGAFDTALIQTGSGANETLRFLTQTATNLVDAIGQLPAPVLGVGLAVTGLVAGVGLLGGGLLTVVPKIAATRTAMAALNISGVSLAKSIGKGGAVLAGLGILTAGLSGLGSTASLTEVQIAKLDAALKLKNLDDLNAQFKSGASSAAGLQSTLEALQSGDFSKNQQGNVGFGKFMAGLGLDIFYKELRESEAALQHYGDRLGTLAQDDFPKAVDGFKFLAAGTDGSNESLRQLLLTVPGYEAALRSLASEQGQNVEGQDLLNLAMGEGDIAAQAMRDAAAKATVEIAGIGTVSVETADQITTLADAVRGYDDAVAGMIDANIDMYQSIDDAKELFGAEGFTGTLDIATQAGRDNTEALLGIARAANEAAAQTYETSGSQDALVGKLSEGRNALFSQARQFFDTDQAAWDYINTLMKTPEQVSTEVRLNSSNARADLNALIRDYDNRQVTMRVQIQTYGDPGALQAAGFAGGGTVYGPGTSKSDSVLTRLSVGEEVIQQPYASMYRGLLKQINRGQVPGYAGGGTVQYAGAGYARSSSVNVVVGDRPIYTDNGAFVGMIRELAGGEARLEIAGYDEAQRIAQNRGAMASYS